MSGEVSSPPRLVAMAGDGSSDPDDHDVPRRVSARHSLQDTLFVHGARATGLLVLVMVSAIGLFLGVQSVPTLQHYGLLFFTESRWVPSQDIIGISAVVLGPVQVALIAPFIAVPLS